MLEVLPNWHPIFVHFSVALLSVAAALHVASHFVTHAERAAQCALVARWNLWLGAGLTLFTVAAGFYAYNTVTHDTPSHAAMTEHRNWALATTVVFLAIVAWEFWLQKHKRGKSWLFTGLLLIATGLLLSTAWHGGELVYRYGLGVMSMPKAKGEGHAHEHGPGAGHADALDAPAPAMSEHHALPDAEQEPTGAGDTHDDGHDH
mgnify:CR=1 FL=1